ncbi:MAG: DUF1385 domain-containing protein [Lachnospiraceae bacterium]|nr:DUF1385 domain-containing protein [Lachnospiraceae bacterium]
MMRSGDHYAVAVRTPDGKIAMKEETVGSGLSGLKKIPLIRGVFAFVDSLVLGTSALMWSADVSSEEEPERELSEKEKKKEERIWNLMMTGTVIFSIALSVTLFILLPYFLADILRRMGAAEVLVSAAEAILRIVIFLIYMLLISRMKDIQRVFAFHGAEHKCINCIEHGLPLTVENVLKSSRQHKRCGTSFLLFVVLVSVIAFLILGALGITSPLWRFLARLIMIPIIAGVSYEILRAAGSGKSRIANVLSRPGLALQKLVTREPDADMAEVAIAAVNAVFDWKDWQKRELGISFEE